MLEIHRDLLWIGNAMEIRSPQELFAKEIAAVVDLAYEEQPAQLPRELIYCRFPINDGAGNASAVLRQAVNTLVGFLDAGLRTVVGCQRRNESVSHLRRRRAVDSSGPTIRDGHYRCR